MTVYCVYFLAILGFPCCGRAFYLQRVGTTLYLWVRSLLTAVASFCCVQAPGRVLQRLWLRLVALWHVESYGTWDRTHVPCTLKVDSQPLDHQGSPS